MSQYRKYYKYLIPLLVGVVALFIPLAGDFHIESALIAAWVGAFWAGLSGARHDPDRMKDGYRAMSIAGMIYLAGVPLLIYALVCGCYSVHGLGFWLLFPLPSVFFGYAVGRLFRKLDLYRPGLLTVTVLLVIAAGGTLYEFLTLPQLYFFNHVWGWWPGPIYDEAVQLTGAVIGFRGLTLCWILILWHIPSLSSDARSRWIVGLSVLALFLGYTRLEEMGVVTTDRYLQQQLGGFTETGHSRIYYAEDYYSGGEIDRLAKEIEFYVAEIKDVLQVDRPGANNKIEAYLYAHPWQKKRLTGAKFTSYVTVWRETPQIHIARQQLEGSFKHEVVHAVTALLEGPGLLPNIGLTEGIAVALAPDRSGESTIDQLVAARETYPSTEDMASALSYWGFYTARSAVSYTTTGSFVRFLLDSYPPERFLTAWAEGRLEAGYAEPIDELVEGWHRHLDTLPVDSGDVNRADEIFGVPSLFEQECPHILSEQAELFDRYRLAEIEKDTVTAIETLGRLKEIDTGESLPRLLWGMWNLRAGRTGEVIAEAALADTVIDAQLLYADALMLDGRSREALRHLNRAFQLAVEQSDTTYNELFAYRLDPVQWSIDLGIRYDGRLPDREAFEHSYYFLKIRSLRHALRESMNEPIPGYARSLIALPADRVYFDNYLEMVHRLVWLEAFGLAEEWLDKLAGEELSLRHQERLEQERRWLEFLHVP